MTLQQRPFVHNAVPVPCLIGLDVTNWEKNRVEEVLVSNSSLVSGPSEASGVKSVWVEVSQESQKKDMKTEKP